MDFWYKLTKLILKLYLAVCTRNINVTGGNHLQPGPKIIAANHPNVTDGFILPLIIQEKLHFLIQSKTFNIPILHTVLKKAGQIPVVKGQGRIALDCALEKLAEGKVVVIFPEGKLNHGEKLHRGRSGAAVLAHKSGAPIVPIGFFVPTENTAMWQGRIHNRLSQARWQVRGNCFLHIGQPWQVPRSDDTELDPVKLRETTEKIMRQIARLVDQAREEARNTVQNPIHLKAESVS